jgi:hypothetical protein
MRGVMWGSGEDYTWSQSFPFLLLQSLFTTFVLFYLTRLRFVLHFSQIIK